MFASRRFPALRAKTEPLTITLVSRFVDAPHDASAVIADIWGLSGGVGFVTCVTLKPLRHTGP